ncbi:hypothetical protein SAMN04488112_11178 [Melghirimyces thermohalophilus]|uniref:Uncharacterized protein n=1 Tax=Melghirimyces thermohalophilus TaxID=1236220 RepID=A0A1G6N190_9BACL|nr:hypothetical protein SAMN04488112_11178 [Melghirimyces thermohalophilus]
MQKDLDPDKAAEGCPNGGRNPMVGNFIYKIALVYHDENVR